MDELCARSDEKLMRVRNLGVKSFEIAVMMREMYAAEDGK
jgi:DNA-directed RNA polymerase alpha subunit